MSKSMLGNEVKLKDKEREEIVTHIDDFLKRKQKITICTPLPPPSIPAPSKITVKAKLQRREHKIDKRRTAKIDGIEYDRNKMAIIEGHKFYQLMPMFRREKRGNDRQYIWACMCDCGQMVDVRTSLLTRGIVRCCADCKKEAESKKQKGAGWIKR